MDIECVNQHFLAIAHKTIDNLPYSSTCPLLYISSLNVPDMTMAEVEVGEVYRHICCLNIHKAMGVDNTSTKFIKASPMVWLYFLLSLLTKALHFILFLIFGKMPL